MLLGVGILLTTPVEAQAHGGELMTAMTIFGGHFIAMVSLWYWIISWPGPSGQRIGAGCGLVWTIFLSFFVLVLLDKVLVWKHEGDPDKTKLEFLVSLAVPWICGILWRAHIKKNQPPGSNDDR